MSEYIKKASQAGGSKSKETYIAHKRFREDKKEDKEEKKESKYLKRKDKEKKEENTEKKKLSKKAKEWIGQKQHIDYSGTNPTRPQGGWKD